MITHIVFFNVKTDLDKSNIVAELKAKLLALNKSVPSLKHLEFGVDFSQSELAYDCALYSTFNTKADLDAYQVHPEHVKVKEYIGQVCANRVVVDYEL